jgi:hypothetical protein
MRAAAASIGAELLPARAQTVYLYDCQGTVLPEHRRQVDAGCLTGVSADGKALRFVDVDGKKKLAIRVAEEALRYARLARRGSAFVILNPVVWRREIGKKTACECDAGLRVIFDFQYSAFVTDDVANFEVRELAVDVREDFVDWECKMRLVRRNEWPHVGLGLNRQERPTRGAPRPSGCGSRPRFGKL